ncbi:flagellar basal body rod protein FlgG [Bacillus sp. 7586-K]|uniref:Flagellar hook protein FlgE n=1 Tax=Metabacillus niabensis TaxID=324854 RepID=A0ABT9Z712_9BACI|nr:flagellar basal body rod protein FlgG [Metabacillus niabensis]MDQ0227601.1 flagellar hook protein FlgE [Metabacillus niabensis]PAD70795.1 flagellar basal body rod protein FlgG [Bacillus sp. 7586-K]
MLRSLYSGISGMKNFQTKLDVIGNNIANVNTYGFKKSRTTFSDLFSQQISGAAGATANSAGTNAKEVGLGSKLSSIDTIHTTGSTQMTNRNLDLALQGDGMFVVGTINNPGAVNMATNTITEPIDNAMSLNFTRAGNFYLDDQGYLVTAEGLYVIGEAGNKTADGFNDELSGNAGLIQIPLDAQSFSIGPDGTVNFINANGQLNVAGQIRVVNFANEGGLEKVGGNLYQESANSGSVDTDGVAGVQLADLAIAGEDGTGKIAQGALEMSNVDLSEEFTEMIVAQRGFQSNTKIITTSDEILQELMGLKR